MCQAAPASEILTSNAWSNVPSSESGGLLFWFMFRCQMRVVAMVLQSTFVDKLAMKCLLQYLSLLASSDPIHG